MNSWLLSRDFFVQGDESHVYFSREHFFGCIYGARSIRTKPVFIPMDARIDCYRYNHQGMVMKFYKILNDGETQYYDGLNIDREHGISFAEKNILYFSCNGPWIRDVTIPDGIERYRNPDCCHEWMATHVIFSPKRKITVDVIHELDHDGCDLFAGDNCALIVAAGHGDLDTVRYLVEHGADIHDNDNEAILWAIKNGQTDVVQYLIEHGANIYRCCRGHSPITAAYEHGRLNMLKLLNIPVDLSWFPIIASYGHLHMVEYLVDHGANVNKRTPWGDTALRMACAEGYEDIVKYLIENGADVNIENGDPLRWAVQKGRLSIVEFLIKNGADIHVKNDYPLK